MLLLALDTSTSAVTVALHDGRGAVAEWSVRDPRAHAEQCAPGIRHVLAEAGRRPSDVTLVVVGRGPGPFTGLRVGIMTAVVFGYAAGIPVAGVCSLDALAWRATRLHRDACRHGFVVATDARRREVYWARYQPARADRDVGAAPTAGAPVPAGGTIGADIGGWSRVGDPAVGPAAAIGMTDPAPTAVPVVGLGGRLYPDGFGQHLGLVDVDATAVAELALQRLGTRPGSEPGETLDQPTPLYLRRPDALTTAERLRGRS